LVAGSGSERSLLKRLWKQPAAGGLRTRLRSALVSGTDEVVDHTAPWIIFGLAVAALVSPWLTGGWFAGLPSPVAILLFAALGFPTYVCAASATPLVATLPAAGLTPGAGIAFLITGPATNLSTLDVPTLAKLTEETPFSVQILSLAGLTALFGASVTRRGIRRFVGEIREGLGSKHDHEHAHA
jgi:uncharacterized membrane protein YraQ (UPF0718 family)